MTVSSRGCCGQSVIFCTVFLIRSRAACIPHRHASSPVSMLANGHPVEGHQKLSLSVLRLLGILRNWGVLLIIRVVLAEHERSSDTITPETLNACTLCTHLPMEKRARTVTYFLLMSSTDTDSLFNPIRLGWLISSCDQPNDSCVVSQFNYDVGQVDCYAVMNVQEIGGWTKPWGPLVLSMMEKERWGLFWLSVGG